MDIGEEGAIIRVLVGQKYLSWQKLLHIDIPK